MQPICSPRPASGNGLREILAERAAGLEANGIDSPRLSAELLLAKALGITREELLKRRLLAPDERLPEAALHAFDRLIERRAKGEPAAYILGRREFYGRAFTVTPDTLIPRPETELLVDLALSRARGKGGYAAASGPVCGADGPPALFEPETRTERPASGADGQPSTFSRALFADMGTGTGCIAVTLALELPGWHGIAVDKNPAALTVARANASRLKARNLSLVLADFRMPPLPPRSLDMLVANPPYVSEAEYRTLSREVRDFEPKSALVPESGPAGNPPAADRIGLAADETSGTEDARALIAAARSLLRPGGLLLLEIGCSQAPPLLALLAGADWTGARAHKDLAGLDRVIAVRRAAF